jgi:hypothetical protein
LQHEANDDPSLCVESAAASGSLPNNCFNRAVTLCCHACRACCPDESMTCLQIDLTADRPLPAHNGQRGAQPASPGTVRRDQTQADTNRLPFPAPNRSTSSSTHGATIGTLQAVQFERAHAAQPAQTPPPPLMPQEEAVPQCPLCLEPMKDGLCTLPCGHVFHYSCMKDAYKSFRKCPKCRKGVRSTSQITKIYFN